MKKIEYIMILLILVVSTGLLLSGMSSEKSLYDFTMKTIDGQDLPLVKYKGKVILVVNTASKCGLTPQYKGLQALYQEYKAEGFVILGFPANNFLQQEPGTNAEIKQFCSVNYGVTFPMFSKISVKGDDIHPLYRYLTGKETNPKFSGEIRWNFDKFLFDRKGNPVARFHPKTTPDSPEVLEAVKTALKEK